MGLLGLLKPKPTPVDENNVLRQLLKDRDTRWYAGDLLKLNLIIFFLLITSMSNGYDGSMMNGLQTLENWQEYFDNPQGGLLGLFNAIQNIGTIVALPFAPMFNDYFGRRWTLFIGSCICLIAVAIQTAAQNMGMFIGARALIGAGNALACIASPVLITEIAFPSHRAQLTSLYNATWYLGSIVAAWTTFGTFRIESTWSWRIPSVLQGLPPLIQACLILFFPESPRWLVDHGRDEQALHVLAKYHCSGNLDDPLVAFEYDEIKEGLRMEREIKASDSHNSPSESNGFVKRLRSTLSSYKQLFTTKGNLKRMRIIIAIAFFSQWSGNGLVSYYLNIVLDGIGITSEFDKNLFNGILQIYNLGTAYLGALVVERAGRRVLFLTSTAGMCITYAIWTACSATYQESVVYVPGTEGTENQEIQSANTNAGNAVAAMIFIYYGFYNIALSPLLVSYTVEILPFRIRSKGLMVMQLCVSASLVFNQYVNPIALGAIEWRYYIVYTIWLAFEFTYLYFFLIETKGRNGHQLPLEEISALFDGDGSKEEVARSTEAAVLDKPQKTDLAQIESGLGSSDNVNVTQIEKVDRR